MKSDRHYKNPSCPIDCVVDQWCFEFGFVKYLDCYTVFFRPSDVLPDESGAIPDYKVVGTRVRIGCPNWLLNEVPKA